MHSSALLLGNGLQVGARNLSSPKLLKGQFRSTQPKEGLGTETRSSSRGRGDTPLPQRRQTATPATSTQTQDDWFPPQGALPESGCTCPPPACPWSRFLTCQNQKPPRKTSLFLTEQPPLCDHSSLPGSPHRHKHFPGWGHQ